LNATTNNRIDGVFLEWSVELWNVLDELFPLSAAMTVIPEDELLPPRYKVSLASSNPPNSTQSNPLDLFPCTLIRNKRITAPGHWQDVRHIIVSSQNPIINYEPGDIAVIYPQNPPEEVNAFLDILHWSNIADHPLLLTYALTGSLPSLLKPS
jgi:sulfite reductase alpha subunit-like flavoprotein